MPSILFPFQCHVLTDPELKSLWVYCFVSQSPEISFAAVSLLFFFFSPESRNIWVMFSGKYTLERELVCFEPRHGKVSVQVCWWREERAAWVREGARSGRLVRAKGRRFQVSHGLLLAQRFHTCGVTSSGWRLAGVTQSPTKTPTPAGASQACRSWPCLTTGFPPAWPLSNGALKERILHTKMKPNLTFNQVKNYFRFSVCDKLGRTRPFDPNTLPLCLELS